jgi:hypothetical protein
MNSTNRAANRIVLILVGVMTLAAGLAALAASIIPGGDDLWRHAARSIQDSAGQAGTVSLAFLGLPDVAWLLLMIPIAAALLIAALFVFVFRQGRGHTDQVVSALPLSGETGASTVTVSLAVAGDFLQHALSGASSIAGLNVSAYRIRHRPALKLTVTPRRGADPARVLAQVDGAVAAWDDFLGQRIPAFVHLNAGIRTAFSTPTRAG